MSKIIASNNFLSSHFMVIDELQHILVLIGIKYPQPTI